MREAISSPSGARFDFRWLAIAAVVLAAACTHDAPKAACAADTDCGDGRSCVNGDCVLVGACTPTSTPQKCGDSGSACRQQCTAGNQWGPCLPASGPTDYQTDPRNCGRCGNACPAPLHASARCVQGRCGRGPCEQGFFDLDGDKTYGCESTCKNRVCTGPGGVKTPVTVEPLPETGPVFQALVASSSLGASPGASVQTDSKHTNTGILGEPTPSTKWGVEQSNASHRHLGGFMSVDRK